ncbi:MAG: DNA replication/repair protein RecF [Coriobacteriia bacterium]
MLIERVTISQFRNYETKDVSLAPLTILVGENASGKTNFIEAVRTATGAPSFRTRNWSEMVRRGADEAQVKIRASGESSTADAAIAVTSEGKRSLSLNGKAVRSAAKVMRAVPTVVFTPDDLELTKGPPQARRDAVDTLGSFVIPGYSQKARDYSRALRQRNRLLKEGAKDSALGPWDEQLALLGGRLRRARVELVGKFSIVFARAYSSLANGEEASLEYVRHGGEAGEPLSEDEEADRIARDLSERREDERRRGTTLAGPHRDDVRVNIGGMEARPYASQGQHRTCVLAWKMAELGAIDEATGRRPVLLLDDVMSELDESRREALTKAVGSEIQKLVTTTNLGYFSRSALSEALVIEVSQKGEGEA